MLNDVFGTHGAILGAPNQEVNRRALSSPWHSQSVTIGKRISMLRESKGLSGPELAGRVGIKPPSLWEIENGETKSLKASTLMRLAAALDANPYFIWTGHGSPVSPIDPNVEEAQTVDLFRRMTPANQAAWIDVGNALLRSQPAAAPSARDPFPTATAKPRRSRK